MTKSARLLAAPDDLTALESLRAVAIGSRSVSAVTGAALERIAEAEGELRAWRSVDETAVRERAKRLDAHSAGALRGTLVGVKDVIDTADSPTGYGSALFSEHQPTADADVVACLRSAGALVVGKTESTEFAMFQPTRTCNPADVARTPGGSSSGSAAAVAAGMVPVALGTQTAGSVIRPAAYCGVYGFKPSRRWTSAAGVWLLSESLDTVGLFARTVADLHLLYEALRSPAFSQPARPRPGGATRGSRSAAVLTATEWGDVDRDVLDALEQVARVLRSAGWAVEEMAMPEPWRHLPGHHATVMAVEVAHNLRAALGDRVDHISESARGIVELGDATPAREYVESLEATREAADLLPALSRSVDVLLTPSALGVAPVGLDFTGDPVMCRPWTLLGLPCSNIPAVRRHDGLPVGVQAVAPACDDLAFLEDLAAVEASLTVGD
jgi:Asp-tRNA(Asn)/Glu-tRNA(Gln) amidotransferase A subunit family amidase